MKIVKELIPYVVIVIVVVLIRLFIITPVSVSGDSMIPTLIDRQIVLLNKLDKKYERFDIVVVRYCDGDGCERIIKRVIGLPGETIEKKQGILYINGEKAEDYKLDTLDYDFLECEIGENQYFVMGDNRIDSLDSRIIGPIDNKDIVGSVSFSLFPFKRFGKI